ncbi:hypothetical protein LEP1GSC039_3573 [Leptospira santarosai str. 2000027870]|nr:hypothetical protein LEP1GSC039_3573 [Leptospira santarosai str. 2000027870]
MEYGNQVRILRCIDDKLVKVEVPHDELEKVEDPFLKTIVRE